jgi:uncharacterized protein
MKRQEMMQPVLPWWRVPTVWLVIGGPLTVVVAGVVTMVIALRHGDVPLRTSPVAAEATQAQAFTPATQARTHAAAPRR